MDVVEIKKTTILKIFLWLVLITLMCVIFCFSHQQGGESQDTSDGLLFKLAKFIPNFILNWIFSTFGHNILSVMVRKTAHFILYLLFGTISFSLFYLYFPQKLCFTAVFSWIFSTIYAISDEIHQYFIPGRSAEISDVILDSLGALVGILLCITVPLLYKKKKKIKNL